MFVWVGVGVLGGPGVPPNGQVQSTLPASGGVSLLLFSLEVGDGALEDEGEGQEYCRGVWCDVVRLGVE